jgi:hypothetical protein
MRTKLMLLIALTVVIVLALQGAAELPFGLGDSFWDGH